MAYEIMTKGARTTSDVPLVSIGKAGIIYVNSFAMKNYFQGKTHVLLLHDKQKGLLAIRPLEKEQPKAFRLNFSSQERKSTGMITARSPLKALKLEKVVKKDIPAVWNEKENLLEVKLS